VCDAAAQSAILLRQQWTTISEVYWMRLYRSKIRAIQTDEQAREAIYAYQRDVAAAIIELNKGVNADGK